MAVLQLTQSAVQEAPKRRLDPEASEGAATTRLPSSKPSTKLLPTVWGARSARSPSVREEAMSGPIRPIPPLEPEFGNLGNFLPQWTAAGHTQHMRCAYCRIEIPGYGADDDDDIRVPCCSTNCLEQWRADLIADAPPSLTTDSRVGRATRVALVCIDPKTQPPLS